MSRKLQIGLGIMQIFIALGALPAGYLLMAHPDGSGMMMSTKSLAGSPFRDFFIPGLFLFTVNGIFNLISGVLCFFKNKYTWEIGFLLGIALLIWIGVQVWSIGLNHFLQPTYFIIGIIEIVISLKIRRSE